ncbi:hypothetical protein JAAARDRAFT_42494 [Jaapia argillacea MUCL 33604]|uniref:AAA+ ATPase domain-containing protein n=1 Tax=Jaapia argillacea MUCL 33604 TaxID=933084 RepID=A0A067PFX6_9AGAM|nr:hypothetical protein JAAARDRAFT_42494 [Jaapia argillacea MUCL 33604]
MSPFENTSNIGEDFRTLRNPDPTRPDYSSPDPPYSPTSPSFPRTFSTCGSTSKPTSKHSRAPPFDDEDGPSTKKAKLDEVDEEEDPHDILMLEVFAPAGSQEAKVDVPIVENNDRHYLIKEVIRDEDNNWVPYDPSLYVKPPPVVDVHNYFTVNIRHDEPGDAGSFYLSDFSQILIDVMRSLVGNRFFRSSPECTVESLFPNLRSFHNVLASAQSAVSLSEMSMDEKREIALSLGATEAKSPCYTEEQVSTYLNNAITHLEVLLGYLDEQFQSIADRLKLLNSYGQIEYDQLIYYFQPQEKYSTSDCAGPIAFILDSREYDTCDKCFVIEGTTYIWDGDEYTKSSITRRIDAFPGSLGLEYLSCKLLTPELEAKFTERGRLYTTLSGVHYKQFIVDRRAWNSEQGHDTDPWGCRPDRNVSLADPSRSSEQAVPKIDDKLLYLLPPDVYGFNLTRKTWTKFAVENLEPVVFDENAWDHLVIDADTKTLIKGLVEVTRNANSSTKIITDVISGKGGGLISVLHGPPGTGKTLTAEAVAEHLKRPLYMVGSSELSTNPSHLERNLKSILNLATAWDAVLLIDEADVFLERRSLHELERNALVSVALRVLEYHRGVLFLTTNRIGSFDEAFMSRFSIGIKYPELDHTARRIIWRKFFELAGIHVEVTSDRHVGANTGGEASSDLRIISAEDLEYLSAKTFNGRTIKNLVRTSQALALSQNQPMSIEHVKIVVRASEKFLDEFGSPSK